MARRKQIFQPLPQQVKSNIELGIDPNAIVLPAHGWKCRGYQKPLWEFMYSGGSTRNKRGVVNWHRRAGKDLFAINFIAHESSKRPGLYWHMFPLQTQGRKAIWEGYTADGRKYLDYLPHELRTDSVNATEMRMGLRNGSTYQIVGADNADKLRGAGPVGIVMSEAAWINKDVWNYIRPMLVENEGWVIFISTPQGRNNFFHEIYNIAEREDGWFHQTVTAKQSTKLVQGVEVPVLNQKFLDKELATGMPQNVFDQEYMCSWSAAVSGAYYDTLITAMEVEGRITDVPVDPILEVHTAWDVGYSDTTVIIFFQKERGGGIRIVDCYANSGEGMAHYAGVVKARHYKYGQHWGPHDLRHSVMAASGQSLVQTARQYGINFLVCGNHLVDDGIEAVRSYLPRMWIDKVKCAKLIQALSGYKKKYKSDTENFASKPTHDWTSHYCDAMRYLCYSLRPIGWNEGAFKREERYELVG